MLPPPDPFFIRWARSFAGILSASSVYVAVSFSVGGLFGLVALSFGLDYHSAFLLGLAIPPGPLYLYFTSRKAMERRLIQFQDWKQRGLITAREYQSLRGNALRWYNDRLFGQFPEEAISPETKEPPTAPT